MVFRTFATVTLSYSQSFTRSKNSFSIKPVKTKISHLLALYESVTDLLLLGLVHGYTGGVLDTHIDYVNRLLRFLKCQGLDERLEESKKRVQSKCRHFKARRQVHSCSARL